MARDVLMERVNKLLSRLSLEKKRPQEGFISAPIKSATKFGNRYFQEGINCITVQVMILRVIPVLS